MKDFIITIVLGIVCGLIIISIKYSIDEPTIPPDVELSHDPKYNQLITSDSPMIVSQHQVGDDVLPEIHIQYYNPVSESYYTVVYKGDE